MRRLQRLQRQFCTAKNCAGGLSDAEKYLFDLHGFLILRNVLSKKEVDVCLEAIAKHKDEFIERGVDIKNAKQAVFSGPTVAGRLEHGRFLQWPKEDSSVFRSLLAHPRVAPKLNDLVGEGYRLDHMPLLLSQRRNVEGFDLHGGAISNSGEWNRELAYEYRYGRMYCNLVAMSVQLSDTEADQGGFVIIPGTHKSNMPIPNSIFTLSEHSDVLVQPTLQKGDVILFTEATTHGALPWQGQDERHIALYRFAPATHGYGRGYTQDWPESMLNELEAREKAVLEPPYSLRLDRAAVRDGGAVLPYARDDKKKDFDRAVFDRDYF